MAEVLSGARSARTWLAALSERKFFLLFLFLLGDLILYPYAQNSGSDYLLFRFLGSAVTVVSVYAVSFRRTFILFAVLLALPTLAQRIVLPRADANFFALLGIILSFGFDLFIIVVIFRRVFAERAPNSEAVFGALCVYLIIGFGFAGVYHFLVTFQPAAFHMDSLPNLRSTPDRFDLIYYSFGTMTSLGAAGITPVTDQARSLSIIEAILGVLYLAVLIARLMSAYGKRP